MTTIKQRTDAIGKLRIWLQCQLNSYSGESGNSFNDLLRRQYEANPWLTEEFILISLQSIVQMLAPDKIEDLLKAIIPGNEPKDIGVITTENIPLSGINECIVSFLFGNRIWFTDNNQKFNLLKVIMETQPEFTDHIGFSLYFPKTISSWIIHTGQKGNNPSLIQYFEKKKSLFLNYSFHAGILTGNETSIELENLADYIFIQWGFNSNNIRKIFVPKGYSFDLLFLAFEKYNHLSRQNRYANHYDYQKCVFQMNLKLFMDNGFLILFETSPLNIPIGCIGYEIYETESDLKRKLENQQQENELLFLRYSYINYLPKYEEDAANFSNTSQTLIIEFMNKF